MSILGLWHHVRRGTRRLLFHPDWPRFAGENWADGIMSAAVTDRYHAKQGRSTGRWLLRHCNDQLAVYLKRHRRLPWWQRLLATLLPAHGWSPAFAEWRHLLWAKKQGIDIPEPLAVGEFIGPRFQLQSFLVIRELTGMQPLHEAVPIALNQLPSGMFLRWKRRLIGELARITRILHRARRFHKDLYLCHFFVGPGEAELSLIDLHRLGHHPWTARYWQIKDLAQLLYSSNVAGVSNRDRLRFFHAYVGQPKLDRTARRLLQRVLVKADRYRRHNAKRPTIASAQESQAA